LYTVSQGMIKANDLQTIEELNQIKLPTSNEVYPIVAY